MTLDNIRELLRQAGVEFYVKKEKGNLAKIHVWIEDEEIETIEGAKT
jgi:hypothetical protein